MASFKKLFKIFILLIFMQNYVLHCAQIVFESVKTLGVVFQDPEIRKTIAQVIVACGIKGIESTKKQAAEKKQQELHLKDIKNYLDVLNNSDIEKTINALQELKKAKPIGFFKSLARLFKVSDVSAENDHEVPQCLSGIKLAIDYNDGYLVPEELLNYQAYCSEGLKAKITLLEEFKKTYQLKASQEELNGFSCSNGGAKYYIALTELVANDKVDLEKEFRKINISLDDNKPTLMPPADPDPDDKNKKENKLNLDCKNRSNKTNQENNKRAVGLSLAGVAGVKAISEATVSAIAHALDGAIRSVSNGNNCKKLSITKDKRSMLDYYNFSNDEFDNMVADIKATYGDEVLSEKIIKEICELNRFAKSISDTIKTVHAKYKYRTHHVFSIDNARKDDWRGLHDLRYVKNLPENVFKVVDMQNLPGGGTQGYVLYRDMNAKPKYKTFFPNMTPEEIVELSFEYFQKIDLNNLKILKYKASCDITTKFGLKLRYIIDFTPNQFSFFAMPVGLNNLK